MSILFQRFFVICLIVALNLSANSAEAVSSFGRDQLKGTTRTTQLTADEKTGLQIERHSRNDFSGKLGLNFFSRCRGKG